MRTFHSGLCVALTATVIATGCSTREERGSISLDQNTISFPAVEAAPMTVRVAGSTAWTAEPIEEWIEVTPRDGEFTVTVTDNKSEEERNGSVVVSAAGCDDAILKVNQLAGHRVEAVYRLLDEFSSNSSAISPSGRYVAGFTSTLLEDQYFSFTPTIIDIEHDITYKTDGLHESIYKIDGTMHVSDAGIAFYGLDYTRTLQVDLDGTVSAFPEPAGVNDLAFQYIYGSSNNGEVLYGTYASRINGLPKYTPIKYVDGNYEALPVTGLSYRGTPSIGGVITRGASIDGRIVYGTDWENFEGGMCYWDENGEFHWVGEECGDRRMRTESILDWDGNPYDYTCVEGVQGLGLHNYISPRGKWLAGYFVYEIVSEDRTYVERSYRPYFFDIVNKQGYILDEYEDYASDTATDDGIGFISARSMPTSGIVIDIKTGQMLGDVSSWVKKEYGISIPEGFVSYCAPNGVVFGKSMALTALGMEYKSWIVTPEHY